MEANDSPGAAERLKLDTAEEHRQVESALDVVSPTLDLERYVQLLRFFDAAFVPWEEALERWCPAQYRELWRGREKAHRAAEDLRTLGFTPAGARCEWNSDLSADGVWLGSFYVMEGSTLGGRYIARHLEERFGWRDGVGYSYFVPYGERTSERWRGVRDAVSNASDKYNDILAGARLSYGYLLRHIPELVGSGSL